MRRKALKRATPLKSKAGIRPISERQERINAEWDALVGFLIEKRAKGKCELCPRSPDFRGLQGHHIIPRRFNVHNAGNCLIVCGRCHDHAKYGPGIPVPAGAALVLAAKRNLACGINGVMTGAEVPEGVK